jgi:hypothetical protein
MLITFLKGNLPGLPRNWDASPGIPVKTCDKKERNKNECISDAADELHQQHGPKDYAGHVGVERNGSSSCCEQCHAIRGKLMPYLDNWPTLLEFVGAEKCCNIQHKIDEPECGKHLRCAQSRMPVYWSWPKDPPGYLAYRKADR